MREENGPEAPPSAPGLRRVLGRWSCVALIVNSILGSAIFGLPSVIAGLLGKASPWAVLIAGVAIAVIVACHAEVASQFTGTGGLYLFVRRALGRLVGVQVGWMGLLGRLTACAAGVNLLVEYLGEFWPAATQPIQRFGIIALLLSTLATVNYRGVGGGARISNAAVIGKLVPLIIVCVLGMTFIASSRTPPVALPPHGTDDWLKAILLLFFAYGGFESALNPMGEVNNPQRDIPFALFVALSIIIVIYTTVQLTVVAVLPNAAASTRPLADVARVMLGEPGAALISVGALISVYGFLSANLLTAPRGIFALAERGDFPAVLSAVHPRFRTPHVAITAFALCMGAFAVFGSFSWNVTLSAVARLFYYAAVCVSLPVLRKRQPEAALFRLPGGLFFSVVGVLICLTLVTRVDFSKSVILVATLLVAFVNWLLVRRVKHPDA